MCNTDKTPISLTKWTIQYDERFQMPKTIHGIVASSNKTHEIGSIVQIKQILSLNMMDNIVTIDDKDKTKFRLSGSGHRLLLIPEEEFFEDSCILDNN